MANESSDLIDADTLRNMAADRQIVATSGAKAVNCRLPDYLVNAPFAGLWDPNPMFETDADAPAAHGPGL